MSIYISCPTNEFTVPAIFDVLAVIVDDEALLDAALHALRVLFLVDDVVNSILLFHLISNRATLTAFYLLHNEYNPNKS